MARDRLNDRQSSTSGLAAPEAEKPSPSQVCPRCGTAAEEHQLCSKCGLDLFEQPELPTREMWERQVLAALAAFAAEGSAPRSRARQFVLFLAALGLIAGIAWFVIALGGDRVRTNPTRLSGAAPGDLLGGGAATSSAERRCISDWNSWIETGSRASTSPARSAGERGWAARVSVYEGVGASALNPGDCVITLTDGSSRGTSMFASLQGDYANVVQSAPRPELKKLEAAARRDPNAEIDANGHLSSK
jgi:ribosomal protein L32